MKVVIVHGSNPRDKDRVGTSEYVPQNLKNWIPWIKENLGKEGVECINPLMPESWDPVYEKWKEEFEKISIDETTILIGFSAGSGFLLRYLGETKFKIKKLILVSCSFLIHKENMRLKDFYDFSLDKDLRENSGEIILFISNEDTYHTSESSEFMKNKLEAKLIELKDKGNFTEKTMRTNEFPELLEEILKD